MLKKEDIVTATGEVLGSTKNAILFKLGDNQQWLPKSNISEIDIEGNRLKGKATISIKWWSFKDKFPECKDAYTRDFTKVKVADTENIKKEALVLIDALLKTIKKL